MKTIFAITLLGLTVGAMAIGCGDSGGAGGSSGTAQTCTSEHVCVNNVCNCGADGMKQECTDDVKCVEQCQVCVGN